MPSILTEPDLRICEECGYEFDYDLSGSTCDYCPAYYCQDCDSDLCNCRDESSSSIHSYSYRPSSFRPKGNYPDEVLFGVELEVCGTASIIVDVVESFDACEDHLYMKYDGSICGVEIVTHPMTLAWARDYSFAKLLDALRSESCSVDDGYGLHVHVSRNAFRRHGRQSAAHQMMWLMFMYRNVDDLTALARRPSNRWASFTAPVPGELARKATTVECGERYVAVNCNNAKTLELRFFASTLDEEEFFAALEFADASVHYTQQLGMSDVMRGDALTWPHFTEWVNAHDYPNLSAQIAN